MLTLKMDDELRKNLKILNVVIEAISDIVYVKDLRGRYLMVNVACSRFLKKSAEEIIDRDDTELFPAEIAQQLRKIDQRIITTGVIETYEETITVKDTTNMLLTTKGVLQNSRGDIMGLIGISHDITLENKLRMHNEVLDQHMEEMTNLLTRVAKELQAEISMRKSVEGEILKLYTAVEQSSCVVMITDAEGTIDYVNPRFCRLTGYSKEDIIGKNPRILKSGKISQEEYKYLWDTITSGKEWQGEFYNKKKDGTFYWEHSSISPVKNLAGNITHFLAIKEDITDRKHLEMQLENMIYRDSLTNLFNRRRFLEELESRLALAQRYGTHGALLFLDLDNFKSINDTFGHHMGDEILVQFAHLLQNRIRKTDVLARLGGDEFAVLLTHVDVQQAESIAWQIAKSVRHLTIADKQFPGITVSIGIALFPAQADISKTLLICADLAMYRAKEDGRNRVYIYSPDLNTKIETLPKLEKI